MEDVKPVYLIASERSGTNLLRRRLTDCQSWYFGPSPAHFLKHLYFREPFYGDLAEDRNFLAMIGDALELCYVHFSPWDIRLTAEEVLAGYGSRPRTAIHLAHHLMLVYARSKGFASYFCKDNWLYEFALDIAHNIPDARFIYLYRDPRDFVLSQSKRPGASRNVIEHALLWDYEQVRSIKAASVLREAGRCMYVSYEALIADEQRVLAELCAFLEVEMHAPSGRGKDAIVDAVHEWKNLGGETLKNNSRKFEREMRTSDIARVESICALTMEKLGYQRVAGRRKPPGRVERGLATILYGGWRWLANRRRSEPATVTQRAALLRRLQINQRPPARW